MRRPSALRALAFAAAAALAACGDAVKNAEGHHWTYAARRGGTVETAEHRLFRRGPADFAGRSVRSLLRRIRYPGRPDESEDLIYYVADAGGLAEAGASSRFAAGGGGGLSGAETVTYQPPLKILPARLDAGASWTAAATRARVLSVGSGPPRRSRTRVKAAGRVAGREVLKTPLGDLDCVVVETSVEEKDLDGPDAAAPPRKSLIRRWFSRDLGWFAKESFRGRDRRPAADAAGPAAPGAETFYTLELEETSSALNGVGPLGVPLPYDAGARR